MIALFLISMIFWLAIVVIGYLNISVDVMLNIPYIFNGNIPLGVVIIVSAVAGSIAEWITLIPVIGKLKEQNFFSKIQYEKNSLSSQESSDKVKVLESKIEVLEKALQDALNKKD